MAAYTTIDNPELYFQCKLYTGNGSTQTITYDNTDADLDADMIWLKSRSDAYSHQLFDTVRGATKLLNPEATDAEQTLSGITAFGTDSFNIGSDAGTNGSSKTYVAWCWKESATAGFDILTFEGNGTDDTDISHNLSAVPHWIICRNFDAAKDWCVYHHKNTSAPETDLLVLNTDAATTDTNDRWSDEAPTASVFTVGDSSQLNASSNTSIAYLWSEKQGFSKFGTYTGNANNDGGFIYLGFKPSFFMVKKTDATDDWRMFDNKRPGRNVIDDELKANENGAEGTGDKMDFLSNGVKFRINTSVNTSNTFVYMAFAEAPFVNSKGVPANAE